MSGARDHVRKGKSHMTARHGAAAAAAFLALLSGPAAAQDSNAARYLMEQEIAAACGGPGRIAPEAFVERDLTGDGRADLMVAHEGIACSSGGQSGFCGMQACSIHLYVREGDLLERKAEVLGIGPTVGPGAVPTIRMQAHGGAPMALSWNGRTFVAR